MNEPQIIVQSAEVGIVETAQGGPVVVREEAPVIITVGQQGPPGPVPTWQTIDW